MQNYITVPDNPLLRLIYSIRGAEVMMDNDLANLYGVETKVLNQAVKRNNSRFPESFRFQLTQDEFDLVKSTSSNRTTPQNLRSQSVTSSTHGGRRHLPFVFTEHGVAMLSSVLHLAHL